MILTTEQLTTLKASIVANADPAVVQALADGNNGAIADWYNQEADPAFYLFVSSVTIDEVRRSLDWAEIADDTKFTAQQQFMFNVLSLIQLLAL